MAPLAFGFSVARACHGRRSTNGHRELTGQNICKAVRGGIGESRRPTQRIDDAGQLPLALTRVAVRGVDPALSLTTVS